MERSNPDNLNDEFKNLSLVNKPKNNPRLRQNCRPINVVCNYKKILLNNFNVIIRVCSIKIEPEIAPGGKLPYTLVGLAGKQIRERVGKYMQQGFNLMTTSKLNEPFEVSIDACARSNNVAYKIIISPTNNSFDLQNNKMNIDEGVSNSLKQFLEKVICSALNSNPTLLRFNRKHFCDITKLSDNRGPEPQILSGYSTSVVVSKLGAFIKIGSKNKIINNMNCYDLLQNYQSCEEMKEAFVNKSVLSDYGTKRVYRINDVVFDKKVTDTTINVKTSSTTEETISLLEYYQRNYNKKIKHTNQPLFVVTKKDRNNVESQIFLIPELLLPTGMFSSNANAGDSFKKSVNKTRLRPHEKMKQLDEFFKYLNDNASGNKKRPDKNPNEIRKSWGIDLSRDFEVIQGRELNPPKLFYQNNQVSEINNGKFRANRTPDADCIKKWAYICERNDNNVAGILNNMKSASQRLGLNLGQPVCYEFGRTNGWEQEIRNKRNEFGAYNIVVTMLPFNNAGIYKNIKDIFYTKLGVPSQCLVIGKHKGGNLSSITNVLNQMVVKCNGRLYNIELGSVCPKLSKPSIVVGDRKSVV